MLVRGVRLTQEVAIAGLKDGISEYEFMPRSFALGALVWIKVTEVTENFPQGNQRPSLFLPQKGTKTGLENALRGLVQCVGFERPPRPSE